MLKLKGENATMFQSLLSLQSAGFAGLAFSLFRATAGWSVRPSMSFTDSSKRADNARFLLRQEREF